MEEKRRGSKNGKEQEEARFVVRTTKLATEVAHPRAIPITPLTLRFSLRLAEPPTCTPSYSISHRVSETPSRVTIQRMTRERCPTSAQLPDV
eukprot:362013-Pleurochrysis_carterae.AAC.2